MLELKIKIDALEASKILSVKLTSIMCGRDHVPTDNTF